MNDPIVRAGIDVAAAGTVISSLIGWLPPATVVLAFIWYLFQIWESVTFQKIIGRFSQYLRRKQAKKAIAAGAPLVVLEPPSVPPDAVVVVKSATPEEPPTIIKT